MKLARLASKLYPRWWRERYGDEFSALLEDARPGIGGAFDIAKGAFAMRLSSPRQVFALGAFLGLAVSAIAYFNQPPPPASHALLRMPTGDTPEQASQRLAVASQAILSRTGLFSLVRKLDLYGEEMQRHPIEDVLDQMRQTVIIAPVQGGLVRVEFRGERPKEAADYLARWLKTAGYETFAAAADSPATSPVPHTLVMLGAPAGLLFGLGAAWWLRRKRKEATS